MLNIQKTTNNHLWNDSADTIQRFRNIMNKSKTTFIQFDMIDFYPSIPKIFSVIVLTMQKNYV